MSNLEQTLSIIKPDAVERNLIDEIKEIFDKISYKKGASIIRMMDHFLSTKTFRSGLSNYLNALLTEKCALRSN